jgi:hypothetical protein
LDLRTLVRDQKIRENAKKPAKEAATFGYPGSPATPGLLKRPR